MNAFSVKPDHSATEHTTEQFPRRIAVVFNASVPKKINICNIENSVFYIDRMLFLLCMCADAVCPGGWMFFRLWIFPRMNMCERIYFTVDVSGTSNLFSRFVHPRLAWCGGTTMGASHGWTS